MHPFHFGSGKQPLFGVYHAPGVARSVVEAVVICQPLGHEYIRAHRSLRNLATRLSQGGLHVLRFDYFGCGDSAGDLKDATFERWRKDVATAIDELKDMSGATRVSVVGVRFGATLALLATASRRDIETAVLWDPVARGAVYIEELANLQQRWLASRPRLTPPPGRKEQEELLGFPLRPALKQELEAVDLGQTAATGARRIVLVNSAGMDAAAVGTRLAALQPDLVVETMADDCAWHHAGSVHHAVLATAIVEGISRCFETRRRA